MGSYRANRLELVRAGKYLLVPTENNPAYYPWILFVLGMNSRALYHLNPLTI